MKRTNPVTTALAVAILAIGSSGLAQAQNAPDPHHPAQGEETPQGVTTPQPPMPNDQAGMMGMMRMMNMMHMMNMMQMMNTQMSMMGQGPATPTATSQTTAAAPGMGMAGMDAASMAVIDHVEGRIAFLRAEFRITDAQADAWNAFAAALRDNAKRLGEARMAAHSATATASSLEQELASQEQWLSARLEGVRAIRAAFGPLYKALSVDQQKSADELLRTQIGMMFAGMKPMGMQMGGTTP